MTLAPRRGEETAVRRWLPSRQRRGSDREYADRLTGRARVGSPSSFPLAWTDTGGSSRGRPRSGTALRPLTSLGLPPRPRFQGGLHIDLGEARQLVRLQLSDEVHVGGDDGSEHEVPATRHRIAVKDDGFGASGPLERSVGVAAVYDVGRVGAGAEWLLPGSEREGAAAAKAISDSIGLRRNLPDLLEKGLARLFR